MRFTLKIASDNAAFSPDAGIEVRRILKAVAEDIRTGATSGKAMDLNGNTVGTWKLIGGAK